MKTNYVDMAKRYEMAYRQVWGQLPAWKQRAIREDTSEGKSSYQYEDFLTSVTRLAENESETISEKYPEVPSLQQVQSVHD